MCASLSAVMHHGAPLRAIVHSCPALGRAASCRAPSRRCRRCRSSRSAYCRSTCRRASLLAARFPPASRSRITGLFPASGEGADGLRIASPHFPIRAQPLEACEPRRARSVPAAQPLEGPPRGQGRRATGRPSPPLRGRLCVVPAGITLPVVFFHGSGFAIDLTTLRLFAISASGGSVC